MLLTKLATAHQQELTRAHEVSRFRRSAGLPRWFRKKPSGGDVITH